MFKIGIGYDLHRLAQGRPFRLGGVKIPSDTGPVGHSDGDALLHALTDALLGALGEGDIGRLFPDSDPRWKDALSVIFVREAMARVRAAGLSVVNADVVAAVERPRIAPHVDRMKDVIAPVLGVDRAAVGIKAKTNEGLGDVGEGRAVACWAVVLLSSGNK